MNATRTVIVMILFLSGCGSCQRGAQGPGVQAPEGGGAAAAPTPAAPIKARGKIQAAPVQPGASQPGTTARPRVESNVPATPMQPPVGGAPSAQAGALSEPEEDEGDCIVVADADPDYGPPPLTVTFSAEGECNAGQPSYQWNFGDGSIPNSEINPTHTYLQPGDYTASITITGPGRASASDQVDITVEEDEPGPQE